MDINMIAKIVERADYFSGIIQIVEKNEMVLSYAAGYSKREDNLYNNVDTAFGIASGTKGFTALGILRLIDSGKLSLEDKVFEILPYDFPNMDKDITVEQLISHTSGIYDYFDEEVIEDFGELFEIVPIHKILGPKDMLPLLVAGKAYFKPGERFKYCNSGFVILGILIEVISGMDYADYIQKEVCESLGLTRTGCYKTNQLPYNSAYGYIQDNSGKWYSNIFEIPIACTADGGIFTTVGDMTKFWKNIFRNDFLSDDLLRRMFSIQTGVGWSENIHYGLGFFLKTGKDGKITDYYLVGGDPGVSFSSDYNIISDRIVTILGNTSEGADDMLKEILPYLD